MKVALVHDYLLRMGGAERVLLELHNLFPEAPIYTLLYEEEQMGKFFEDIKVRTSFLQKMILPEETSQLNSLISCT